MTDNDIIKALGSYTWAKLYHEEGKLPKLDLGEVLDLINRQKAEIEALIAGQETLQKNLAKSIEVEAVKEFAEKIDALLSRYSHLHKHADEARRITDEYSDGTPMEMVSVWEVMSLEGFGLVDYETMTTLQDNIETIAKERLLTEFEKDLRLLSKEMAGEG